MLTKKEMENRLKRKKETLFFKQFIINSIFFVGSGMLIYILMIIFLCY